MMLRTVAGLRDRAPMPWTGSWTEPSVQPVRSGPRAARLRGIRADRAPGAPGRASHNPPVVGSSPTRPTRSFLHGTGRLNPPDPGTNVQGPVPRPARLDPAPVPHAVGPRRVRDDLACEDRVEVPEQYEHRKHVYPGDRGTDGPAPRARPGRSDDQLQAERDAQDQEREELQRVVVELGGPLEEQEPGEPARDDAQE